MGKRAAPREARGGSFRVWYSLCIMQETGTAKGIARWIALAALFLIPFAPLVVADTFFFPFITGKAFYIRVLIEIAVSAWIALALLDKEYRPRFSWAGVAVVAFVAWMGFADLFALNVAKAFWSNFERMEGWVFLVHLLGFFFAASAVLRAEKKWRAWFLTSLGVSLAVVGYAFLQLDGALAIHQGSTRIDATLGNSAYLAIYFLFNVFIALWLALTERRAWLKWALLALALLEGVLIFFTETRGTVLGLVGALALAAVLTAFTAGKRARQWAALALTAIVLLAGGFYLARDSSFVQDNHVLQRIASISLADGQVRFTIWHMAYEGMLERPILGWGQEGFNYVFNKYYDPSLYQQEPWFDRAHNAFIDWLMAGGIPAFLLYLSLFASAIVLLWKSSELSRPERIALTVALAGYAVHNFFIFDNLYSYIYFFAILALIDSQVARPIARFEQLPEVSAESGSIYVLPMAAAAAFVLVWTVNVPGMQTATKLIEALSPATGTAGSIAAFEYLAARPSFAAQEVREQIVSFAISTIQSSSAANEEKQQAATLAVREMRKQVAAYPLDARGRLELALAYRVVGDTTSALKEFEASQKLSPKKEQIYLQIGILGWNIGDANLAQSAFNAAYELGPQFPGLAAYAAAGDIAVGDLKKADALLTKVYGTTLVDSDILDSAYYRTKNWPRLIAIWKLRADKPDATPDDWFGLAAAYYASGDMATAIRTLRTAAARFPEAASASAAAISQISAEAGR